MKSVPWSVDRLAEDLSRLGVMRGELLMVHASLRAIGPVDGGAEGVLAAIEAAVGADGSFMMVLGARNDWDWVNQRPEDERAALLRDAEPFDCLVTPAEADVGALAEVFRTRARTQVSDHPEGRFAATGPLADALLSDVPWNDYYGPGSPLERFVQSHGRVLRLGANLDTVTVLHHAEYLAPIASKRRVRRHRLVRERAGSEVRVVECLDDCDGIVDHPGQDYFARIVEQYLATGRARTGLVGNARSELMDGADIVSFGVEWMIEQFRG